jgi:UDP-GlcNAc:undecaprenyl-phosphate/decaprenyl-phosphate GlcNAc-1-phosphate transferase
MAFAVSTLIFLRPVIGAETALLLVAGATVFCIIGLFDDLRNLGAWKLAVEAIVVVTIVWLGGFRAMLPWPYLGDILAILWIVGVANAVNCLDSSDGVAPGTAVVGAMALTLLAILDQRWGIAIGTAAIAGAALGFLRYNFPPARIFLGDAGSLTLGFLLAAFGAALAIPTRGLPGEALAPALVGALPCYDFLFVHIQRYQNGIRNPIRLLTSNGKDHLPHRLLNAGLSPRQVALWISGVSALLGGGAFLLMLWGPLVAVVPLVASAWLVGWAAGNTQGSRRLMGRTETLVPPEVISSED